MVTVRVAFRLNCDYAARAPPLSGASERAQSPKVAELSVQVATRTALLSAAKTGGIAQAA